MSDLEEFKKDVDKDYQATRESILQADQDMRFIGTDGGMWEDFLEDVYNDNRVKLELDITSPYVMRYLGERIKNRANVVFTSDDTATTDDDAELLNGIYRADFKDNDGQIAQDLAIFETAVCGKGAFKISTRFVDEQDPENEDQETVWTPINNAYQTVMFHDTAVRADKADAMRCTLLTAHSPDSFKQQWGKDAVPSSAYTPENDLQIDWFSREVIYVGERYSIKEINQEIEVWNHVEGELVRGYPKDEMDKLAPELKAMGWEFVRTRKLKRRTVEKSIFSGADVLEEPKRIPGKYLPIIPMYGFRTYVGNTENYRGLVRKLKDANRVLNTSVSRMTEDSSASGGDLPVFERSQVRSKDVQQNWAHKGDKSFLFIDAQEDNDGNKIPFGGVATLPAPRVDPNTLAVSELVSNFIQRTTGNAPQDHIDPDASGKAIDSLRERENMETQIITDNIHQSIKHSGRVWEAIAGDIYTRSQMKKVLSKEGVQNIERINIPSFDAQTGNAITLNDLTKGRFSADIEIGPQYESQKAATIGSLERVIEKVGEQSPLQPALVGAWIANIEGTGLDGVKRLNRKMMLLNGTEQPETPEEEQMVAQSQQQPNQQDELNKAIANQQNSEAMELQSQAALNQARALEQAAKAVKTRAEAAETVTDIGIKKSEEAFNQFERMTKRFRFNPETGGLERSDERSRTA